MDINKDVSQIKGIGKKTKENLNKCGINTILDLLLYFPKRYDYNLYCDNLYKAKENVNIIIRATAIKIQKDIYYRKNLTSSSIIFKCGDSNIEAKWFNQSYIKSKFKLNTEYTLCGIFRIYNDKKMLINPTIIEKKDSINEIVPVYSLKKGLTNNFFKRNICNILNSVKIIENLPGSMLAKYQLCSLEEAIHNVHQPKSEACLQKAIFRLKFQELFTYSLKLLILRQYINSKGISFKMSSDLKILKNKLPFKLTQSQSRVIKEILLDQKKDKPMNRLLQGDVGSGKTVIALIALFNVIKNGYQGAFMVPTEVLAKQHYEETKKLFETFNIEVKLLVGSMSSKDKIDIKNNLRRGNIDLIIGTHALLEEDVEFKKLGMVVTDEQHRFGVFQRTKLYNKNENIDILVMSATPIPRTLALVLYGDLDVSVLDELPPGRRKIDTFCVGKKMRKRIYNFALKKIKEGDQVYIVCPLIKENQDKDLVSVDNLYKELKNKFFQEVEVGVLHGKMTQKLKDQVMEKFKDGEIKVLIATTVIEVGVNVPNATLMVIENSDRFGLAQLHQLRGRVGRGSKKSYCILISNLKNEVTRKRMNIMVKSNDGFFIAEQDLKLRGSGEIFGVNQHGEEGLILSNPFRDYEIFKLANFEAKIIMKSNKEQDILIKNKILHKLNKTSKYICFN